MLLIIYFVCVVTVLPSVIVWEMLRQRGEMIPYGKMIRKNGIMKALDDPDVRDRSPEEICEAAARAMVQQMLQLLRKRMGKLKYVENYEEILHEVHSCIMYNMGVLEGVFRRHYQEEEYVHTHHP